MPKRTDIRKILVIGSGPIVIGQGCEFDYSGTQACKALREEGYRIVLVNSNPATIMTDPQFADRTYIEPITPLAVGKIIAAENRTDHRIDALLPTLGGQTGLNTAVALADMGVLDRFGVEMIGATREVIHRAEDRIEFKNLCLSIGLDVPRSGIAHTMDEARKVLDEVGLPVCIRPAYTLGGTGGGFAFNVEEFDEIAARGLEYSPISEILIEESVRGWKEYELEVMRDRADNVVIVCSIENFDPMGVHTGDSITVAPAQTLSDKEYQLMRDAAVAIIRAIGVETGGSNIQFAVDPETGRMIVVEMNPRVSRSSALASKATGFPIAKIAAKLAVGYTLDEIRNDITRETPACFEPTIDYCVVKIPRWTFEKFPDADETLTTQMKSVGEAMSIGRTFKESLQKGIRSREVKRYGLGLDGNDKWLNARRASEPGSGNSELGTGNSELGTGKSELGTGKSELGTGSVEPGTGDAERGTGDAERGTGNSEGGTGNSELGTGNSEPGTGSAEPGGRLASAMPAPASAMPAPDAEWPVAEPKLIRKLANPCQGRLYYIRYALKLGWSVDRIHDLCKIDRWFLAQLKQLVDFEKDLLGFCEDRELLHEYFRRAPEMLEMDRSLSAEQEERFLSVTYEEIEARLEELPLGKLKEIAAEAKASADFFSKWHLSDQLVELTRKAKQWGYSDIQLAALWGTTPERMRAMRAFHHVEPVYKLVDTCAAEFEAYTPYYYSSYETPIRHVDLANPPFDSAHGPEPVEGQSAIRNPQWVAGRARPVYRPCT